jgi:hypothetical protein
MMTHGDQKKVLLALLAVLGLVSAQAVVQVRRLHREAAEREVSNSARSPCDGDARAFCPGLSGPALQACFSQNTLSLSVPCLASRDEDNPMNQWDIACSAEIAQFCSSSAKADRTDCLAQHRAVLSFSCENLVKRQMNIRRWSEVCKAEEATWCRDVYEGQGRVAACLQSHGNDVSEPCRVLYAENPELTYWR